MDFELSGPRSAAFAVSATSIGLQQREGPFSPASDPPQVQPVFRRSGPASRPPPHGFRRRVIPKASLKPPRARQHRPAFVSAPTAISSPERSVEKARRPIDVESLLHWAYREELPKLDYMRSDVASAWAPLTTFGQLLARVQGGSVPAAPVSEGPHPDALLIAAAVEALDGLSPSLGDEAAVLLADMPLQIQAEARRGVALYAVRIPLLVATHARMRTRPGWEADAPEVREVLGKNGRPAWFLAREAACHTRDGRPVTTADGRPVMQVVEENGYDSKTGRPKKGAFRRHYFDPDPALIVGMRLDWLVWRDALETLAAELAEELALWRPLAPVIAEMPWQRGEEDQG